jgi:hypothetical protein
MIPALFAGLLLLLTAGELTAQSGLVAPAPVLHCQLPDVEAARREDARSGLVPRFAIPLAESVHSLEVGEWIALPAGGYVWRLTIRAAGAQSLLLLSSALPVRPGGYLLVRDGQGRQVEDFRHRAQTPVRTLTIGPVEGDRLDLEYYTPDEPEAFRFEHIYYGFTGDFRALTAATPEAEAEAEALSSCLGFNCSLPCQVNAACLENPQIRRSRNSVVRILLVFQEGASWCTGALINNARQDGKPYILSAFHCQFGYTPWYHQWAYFFRYEGTSCTTPLTEPVPFKVTGSELRAKWMNSDFLLLEMTDDLPTVPDITYAGWTRQDNYTPFPHLFPPSPQRRHQKGFRGLPGGHHLADPGHLEQPDHHPRPPSLPDVL